MGSIIEKAKAMLSMGDVVDRLITVDSRKGNAVMCKCPLHGEKTASMRIDLDKGRFHCFGCNASGDQLDLYAGINNMSIGEAARDITGDAGDWPGSTIPQARSLKAEIVMANGCAAEEFSRVLSVDAGAKKYLAGRGIGEEEIAASSLGFAPDEWEFLSKKLTSKFKPEVLVAAGLVSVKNNGYYDNLRGRIVFPVRNLRGEVVAFSGRDVTEESKAKYLNSPENDAFSKKKVLYGEFEAAQSIRNEKKVYVVEGNFDVLAMRMSGMPNTVSPLGTAFTREHVGLLKKYCAEIVLVFDGDLAGKKASVSAAEMLVDYPFGAAVVSLPEGEDPGALMVLHGGGFLEELCANRKDVFEFLKGHFLSLPGGAVRLASEVERIASTVNGEEMVKAVRLSLSIDPAARPREQQVVEQPVSKAGGCSMTTSLDERIYNPGGMISEGMAGLMHDGLPKYKEIALPLVLSAIGRAASGKIHCNNVFPAFYHIRIAPSQCGKSAHGEELMYFLRMKGLESILGPSRLQSGPSIIKALNKNNNMLCVADEVGKMISGDKTGRDSILRGIIDTLLEVYTKNGGSYSMAYSDDAKNVNLDWFSFSLVGNAVPSVIGDISLSSIQNGLIGRINFFCYHGMIEERGVRGGEYNHGLDGFCEKIANLVSSPGHRGGDKLRGGSFNVSTELVKNRLVEIGREVVGMVNANIDDDASNSCVSKIYEDAIRYGLVHMVSSREPWDIYDPMTGGDLEYGYTLAKSLATWKITNVINRITTSDFAAECQVFMDGLASAQARFLAGKDGKPCMRIISRRKKKANWPVKKWREIVEYLVATGTISVDLKDGTEYYTIIG